MEPRAEMREGNAAHQARSRAPSAAKSKKGVDFDKKGAEYADTMPDAKFNVERL